MTQHQSDSIGALQALLKSQKAQTRQLKSLINDKMRARPSSSSSSQGFYTYNNTRGSVDPSYGMLSPAPGSSMPQNSVPANQNFTISLETSVSKYIA